MVSVYKTETWPVYFQFSFVQSENIRLLQIIDYQSNNIICLSLPLCRVWIRFRARAIKGVKTNFKNFFYDKLNWILSNENLHETQEHLQMWLNGWDWGEGGDWLLSASINSLIHFSAARVGGALEIQTLRCWNQLKNGDSVFGATSR